MYGHPEETVVFRGKIGYRTSYLVGQAAVGEKSAHIWGGEDGEDWFVLKLTFGCLWEASVFFYPLSYNYQGVLQCIKKWLHKKYSECNIMNVIIYLSLLIMCSLVELIWLM